MSYILPQEGQRELDRLNRQNVMLRCAFHADAGLLPESVSLPSGATSVIDIAAGTCTWIADLANTAEVQSRRGTPNHVKLYASDISDSKFPSKAALEDLGIKSFLQDATRDFPEEYKEHFDIVNMTCMVFALDEKGFRKALQNTHSILKPGGQLILWDADFVFYSKDDLDKIENGTPGVDLRFKSALASLNRLLEENYRLNGHMLDLGTRLPRLAQEASFTVDSSVTFMLPVGKHCRTTLGLFGQPMSGEEEITLELMATLIEAMTKVALVGGYLMERDGCTRVESEAGRIDLGKSLIDDVNREGAFFRIVELVVRRV